MRVVTGLSQAALFIVAISVPPPGREAQTAPANDEGQACRALKNLRHLTVTHAEPARTSSGTIYCYVQGLIAPAIRFNVQLPFADNWSGRFLMLGDGGSDGSLQTADARVNEGYVVANSNGGHDRGPEPGWSFALHNRQAEIDYGYRAVHLTVNAAKAVIGEFYRKPPAWSYFDGCSAGGRQALMEAQRFPDDFDGIVAGAPTLHFQLMQVTRNWLLQQAFGGNLSANLAFDADKDGVQEDLTKLHLVQAAVVEKCDLKDGIQDGIIGDPLTCDFRVMNDLASRKCPNDVDGPSCFTSKQLGFLENIYGGLRDRNGNRLFKGHSFGSEWEWEFTLIPHAGNKQRPAYLGGHGDFVNYMFFEHDLGVPPFDTTNTKQILRKSGSFPEYGWWEFRVDDLTSGKGELMRQIVDATDPDLRRFAAKGKLIMYHGWADTSNTPEPTLDYYKAVVDASFSGDVERARASARLFMLPGMGHCGGGSGPNEWDKLPPLVDWVEKGVAPDRIIAVHRTNGVVDDQRKTCAYPQRAVYVGPAGGEHNRANWREQNFACR